MRLQRYGRMPKCMRQRRYNQGKISRVVSAVDCAFGTVFRETRMSRHAEQESYATTEILKLRAQWIEKRRAEVERIGDRNLSQMHFARQGRITEEMDFVAR